MQMELAHENRVATLGQITASITHELKQPMAAPLTIMFSITCCRIPTLKCYPIFQLSLVPRVRLLIWSRTTAAIAGRLTPAPAENGANAQIEVPRAAHDTAPSAENERRHDLGEPSRPLADITPIEYRLASRADCT